MGDADLLSHLIEGDAFGAGDSAFIGIVRPRRENEQVACGNSIKKEIGGFEIIADAVAG